MEERFKTLAHAGKRNIQDYNKNHSEEKMPYLVIVIDELADLMSIAPAEIEQAVIRLAQKSRAVGIHLVLATQRPSVNIITDKMSGRPRGFCFVEMENADAAIEGLNNTEFEGRKLNVNVAQQKPQSGGRPRSSGGYNRNSGGNGGGNGGRRNDRW